MSAGQRRDFSLPSAGERPATISPPYDLLPPLQVLSVLWPAVRIGFRADAEALRGHRPKGLPLPRVQDLLTILLCSGGSL
jgi:hypothetical protein